MSDAEAARAAAAELLASLAADSGADLVFYPGLERSWEWGWTFPFSTRDAVEGRTEPFPVGPIVVVGDPPRALVGPSALPPERQGEWVRTLRLPPDPPAH